MGTRVMDYRPEAVRERLVDAFRKRKGEATAADLVAVTGLPKAQVDAELPAVSDEYGARLRVTESGEILWSFPSGFRSRYRGFGPGLKRTLKALKKGAIALGKALFKGWIVLMLVGYFVVFVTLAVLAVVASVAISMAGKGDRDDRRGGGGLGGFWLASRLIEAFVRIWFYSELFKDPRSGRVVRDTRRGSPRGERRPLHKAVFSFVFGDGDPNANWDEVEKKAVVAFLQANKGIMTMPEFMALTGLESEAAEDRVTVYLREFEGSPEVSPAGVLYYSFPALLRRADRADRSHGGAAPLQRLERFSANPPGYNRWFVALNAANTLFGSYFLWGALAVGTSLRAGFAYFYSIVTLVLNRYAGIAEPVPLVGIVLGAVPLAFSFFFFLVPGLRSAALRRRNEAVKTANLRRVVYGAVLDSPAAVKAAAIPVSLEEARPSDPRAADRILARLAAAAGGEPDAAGGFAFPEIARARDEARALRAAVREADFELGKVSFDSHGSGA